MGNRRAFGSVNHSEQAFGVPLSSRGSPVGRITSVNGPLLRVRLEGVRNGEQVRIGQHGLVGEVIGLEGTSAMVQAYDSTESLRPGEPVEALGHPLSAELGPGLLGQIFDGVQRPLASMR